MHQPYYRNLRTGECSMPWARLHATKDYLDMVKRLEGFPAIHQTFNVVPSLLDQLEEYLPPKNHSDRFLELSRKKAEELTAEEQKFILQWFFLAHHERMIRPYPRYHDLLAKRGHQVREGEWPAVLRRFKPADFRDLQVWFNLAWIDPWLRRQDAGLAKLEAKGAHFTEEEKEAVLAAHLALLSQVIPAYRQAAERGQIELTTSPYYHPILPLVCDTNAGRVALPSLPLPEVAFRHPEDARWQLQQGLRRHEQAFGRTARGMWPPEGSVSEEVVGLAIEAGVRWIATDEAILWRTLKTSRDASLLYRPHLLKRQTDNLSIVFRDRELSDLIGFVYSQWEAPSAVADFLKRLEVIYKQARNAQQPWLVSIILDGENAWEFYAEDGHEFLTRLYEALAADGRFHCVTVSEFLKQFPAGEPSLPPLFSGSWIDGNFATWVGHEEKNAAWLQLGAVREALAAKSREDSAYAKAWDSFGAAEGSDWMWWFGDTHFTAQAEEFDRLFRTHLENAYHFAGLKPPEELSRPIRRYLVQPLYEPTGPIEPVIDGRETSYYEWLYAGRVDLRQQYAAIHRGTQHLQGLLYGLNADALYLRVDVDPSLRTQLASWTLEFEFSTAVRLQATYESGRLTARLGEAEVPCAFDRVIELQAPLHLLRPTAQAWLHVTLRLISHGEVLEQYPTQGSFALVASLQELESRLWPV
ncbi:MAG: hypothetical protein HY598_03905 [Candidatus Omnitrophica bacterium]|nr:hypothetical protein [Candidatus Omnitrophota bacterium]